ncbi:MAG TPA: cysteine desulfurase family protein [Gemmatales bacterium]|nr:cysteine desulfurase family protein [Gemmatales bacterium]
MPRLYLDNNSTTPMLPEVAEAMARAPAGNPASAHRFGAAARLALDTARDIIADCLVCHPDEVVFTSDATEANNLAVFGLAEFNSSDESNPIESPKILVSDIEHPSVLEPCRHLAQGRFKLIELPVDSQGHAQPIPQPAVGSLVALQLANHETGVVQDIATLRRRYELSAFHTDATQAVGKIPIRFHDLGVSTLACSAHKFHGPQGIGVLIVNRCVQLKPRTFGGHQQLGRRPGTEPVALAVGMATALKLACKEMNERRDRCIQLRRLFLDHLTSRKIHFVINGDPEHGLSHTLNLAFPSCASELLFIRLDLAGIDCSTGSACSSGSLLPSPVLQAMKVSDEVLTSSMRFSLSHLLSDEDVIEAAERIAREVMALRSRP